MRLMPPTNYSVSAYKAMLSHAVSANHNMLRVWGGGKFLPSVFYDECDKLGVMVYQDVMYGRPWFGGNGSIPLADSSMQHMEVTHNIRRLSAHPCIVVWCAGNEYDGKKKKNDRSIDRSIVCVCACLLRRRRHYRHYRRDHDCVRASYNPFPQYKMPCS
jgi:beta-galactosidase/beta-glucuronidase